MTQYQPGHLKGTSDKECLVQGPLPVLPPHHQQLPWTKSLSDYTP
jgi:hypothetical protein